MNSFADFFWYMIEFYILFMIIWIFIRVFADIFRRTDLTGVMKGLWVLCIFIIPFFGALVYIITRPKTAGDLEFSAGAAGTAPAAGAAPATVTASAPAASPSVADQIAKLSALHDAGTLTDSEYEAAKAKALA